MRIDKTAVRLHVNFALQDLALEAILALEETADEEADATQADEIDDKTSEVDENVDEDCL